MRGRRQNPRHTAAKRDAACPTCGARPGESCRKARGGVAWPPHKARIVAATGTEGAIRSIVGPRATIAPHNRDAGAYEAHKWLTAQGYDANLADLRALADECFPSRGSFASYWQRIAGRWVDAQG